jgi:hypothetical protein
MASSPLPFLAGGDLQKKKSQQPVDFSFFLSLFSDLLLFLQICFFVSPSLFQVAGCMTKKLLATVLLSCLAGGDGGERSVVWSSVSVGFAAVACGRWSCCGDGRGCWRPCGREGEQRLEGRSGEG